MSRVALVIGSTSDKGVGDKIQGLLQELGVDCDYQVISAHRTPHRLDEYVRTSEVEVYIAVAGLSAALPGAIASRTLKPVIGVPREVRLQGVDALLSIVQMPPGVPVACVGIENWKNAALLALEILALTDAELEAKLAAYRGMRN
jgi:5-(carboxyamino)imidazole ribonucleotide mutase